MLWLVTSIISLTKNYLCKLITVTPKSNQGFNIYYSIIQNTDKGNNSSSVLFEDCIIKLFKIEADAGFETCFVVESDSKKKIISVA